MSLPPRPYLLLLFPGPIYFLEEQFRARLEKLSGSFEGVVLTTSPAAAHLRMGRFDVISVTREGRPLSTLIRFALAALRVGWQGRREGRRVRLVATYDPLRTGLIGWLAARIAGARLVVEVNGDYTSWANYADVPNRLRRRLKRALFMAVERFVLGRADGIKLLYPGQIDAFRSALRTPAVRVFPDFVELGPFADRGEEPEVLLVGFPFHVKGVDLLVSAFKRVADGFPAWRLKILGWYPDPSELQRAIGGHSRISHHPPVNQALVAEHIGRCGIFALPSRTEAMGRVLLESAASGKPRIGARVGGIPTVIDDGEDGILVEPEDVEELAEALRRLMGDAELRRRMGTKAFARAQREFGPERYLEHLSELYDEVLGSRHVPGVGCLNG